MRLRKFTAPTASAALREVKRELGEDALILGTRDLTGGAVEITAATDVDRVTLPDPEPPPPPAGARRSTEEGMGDVYELLQGLGSQLRRLERRLPPSAATGDGEAIELEADARDLARTLEIHGLARGVGYDLAQRFQERRLAGETFDVAVAGAITDWMPRLEGTPAANVRFLVGPTGSGKTTTIAKLAADDVLGGRESPLLVNADTMRIGAGEQLAAVARLLDLETHSVNDASELQACLNANVGRPVYVDTAGLSSDPAVVRSIRALVDGCGAKPAVTAVVSATAARSSLQRAWTQLELLSPGGCAVTHLDESDEPGIACSWVEEVGLPLRWLGTGQRVPQDLAEASGANLALWLVAA